MEPSAVPIISSDSDNILTLDEKCFIDILLQPHIRNRYVSVISITGAFRQGKSFLLNFLLRYLRINYKEKRNVTDWLSEKDGPLGGFKWVSGSRRHTTGIQMWSEIFLTKLPSGEDVAVILLDTQGAFDHQSTVSDSAKIFALSTLISSVQIYNLMRNINQYDFSHLQLFANYGSMFGDSDSCPFQNLNILVRDWPYCHQQPYGADGGSNFFKETIDNNRPEVKTQIENVLKLFSKVSCFLLPYPGYIVDTSESFNGDLKDIDDAFKKHVQDLAVTLLSPENLVLKTFNKENITAESWVTCLREYCRVLKEGDLPQVETIFKANVEASHKIASHASLRLYEQIMDNEVKYNQSHYTIRKLFEIHSKGTKAAIVNYREIKKIEDEEIFDKYLVILKNSIDSKYTQYLTINNEKKEKHEATVKKMKEQTERNQRQGTAGSSGLGLGNLNGEAIGTAVAVVGAIGVAAFGIFKALSGARGNND